MISNGKSIREWMIISQIRDCKMLKVCINRQTGNGRLGGHHTDFAFTGLAGVKISALADANIEAQKNYFLTGAEKLYSSFEEMMECEKPDIVVLASRLPDEHSYQIKYALERNCHILCEKPLASTVAQAKELITLAQKKKRLVQMAHLARFAPVFWKMKEMISSGEIGRVISCHMRGKEDYRGGGEDMLVLGTHMLDISTFLFGLPLQVISDIRLNNAPLTVDDIMPTAEPIGPCGGDEIYSIYRFANGVNGIFESRRNIVSNGNARLGITVVGTEGTLSVRYSGKRELRICRNAPVPPEDEAVFETVEVPNAPEIPGAEKIDMDKWNIDSTSYPKRFYVENNRRAAWNLLQAIDGKEELRADIASALASLEMITGAYQSAIEHRTITFPLENSKHPLER